MQLETSSNITLNETPDPRILPGIEVVADNHQLVVAPSMHPSGRRYQWESDAAPWEVELPELPHRLLLRMVKLAEPAPQPWRRAPFDMAGGLHRALQPRCERAASWHATGGQIWEFRRCPFADRHTTGPRGANIGVDGADAPVAGCLHSHCVVQWNFKTLRGILQSLRGAGM